MSRFRPLVSLVRRALGLPPLVDVVVDELCEITVEALDPEPVVKGQPLSHRDVEHQQAQMKSAAKRPPAPPARVPRNTLGAPGTSRVKPR